jgi:hypothetical protein
MGLDMYLTKRVYVKNWDHMDDDQRHQIVVKRGGKPVPKDVINTDKVSEVVEEIGYWRKANAVHAWFVRNVQNGEDDCKEYYVSREKATDLLEICQTIVRDCKLVKGKVSNGKRMKDDGTWEEIFVDGHVLSEPSVAHELLPTQAGFFFGSTGYDEWYLDDIKQTIEIMNKALASTEGEIYYQSSW